MNRAIIPCLGYSKVVIHCAGIAILSWRVLAICFFQVDAHSSYSVAHKPNNGVLGSFSIFSKQVFLYYGIRIIPPYTSFRYTFEIILGFSYLIIEYSVQKKNQVNEISN